MKILLLDMDGTLLTPYGYHLALQETVAITGRVLGYENVQLTPLDITAFEAVGVISEWDSAAICAAIMLENLFLQNPHSNLPICFPSKYPPIHNIPHPKFQGFAHLLADTSLQHLNPLQRARRLLLDKASDRTPEQNQALVNILGTARQMDGSLTHRIFQELVLGSETFESTYNLPPVLHIDSYLLAYDRPNISVEMREILRAWLHEEDHQAVIFTGRPSRSPTRLWSSPEAELGAQCVGIETLSIAGWGGITWLSTRLSCDPLTLLKPAPAHALLGLRLALGDVLETSLEKTAAFVLDSPDDGSWEALQDAEVFVFEDAAAGITSVLQVQNILQDVGIHISVYPIGISDKVSKQDALEEVGATVFDDFSEALALCLNPDGFSSTGYLSGSN